MAMIREDAARDGFGRRLETVRAAAARPVEGIFGPDSLTGRIDREAITFRGPAAPCCISWPIPGSLPPTWPRCDLINTKTPTDDLRSSRASRRGGTLPRDNLSRPLPSCDFSGSSFSFRHFTPETRRDFVAPNLVGNRE